MCLATIAVKYDVIQSVTKKEETDGINDEEEEMQNTENDNSVTGIKFKKKKIGYHQEKETGSNTTYKKVQNSHRIRKILPFKAASLLSIE